MEFDVDCQCGKTHSVSHTAAGTNLVCSCGNSVVVPSLAQLRRKIGLKAVEQSPADLVNSGVKAGVLPPQECFVCGQSNSDEYGFMAICESSNAHTRGRFNWGLLLLTLFFPVTIFSWRSEETKVVGRDTVVPVPISLCYSCKGVLPRPYVLTILRVFRWLLVISGCVLLLGEFAVSNWLIAFLVSILLLFVVEKTIEIRSQSRLRSLLHPVREYRLLMDHFPGLTIVRW